MRNRARRPCRRGSKTSGREGFQRICYLVRGHVHGNGGSWRHRTLADHADDAHACAAGARNNEALVLEGALRQALHLHRAVQARDSRRGRALRYGLARCALSEGLTLCLPQQVVHAECLLSTTGSRRRSSQQEPPSHAFRVSTAPRPHPRVIPTGRDSSQIPDCIVCCAETPPTMVANQTDGRLAADLDVVIEDQVVFAIPLKQRLRVLHVEVFELQDRVGPAPHYRFDELRAGRQGGRALVNHAVGGVSYHGVAANFIRAAARWRAWHLGPSI